MTPVEYLSKLVLEEHYVPPLPAYAQLQGAQNAMLSQMGIELDREDQRQWIEQGYQRPEPPPPPPKGLPSAAHPCARLNSSVIPAMIKNVGCQGICSLTGAPCFWYPHTAPKCPTYAGR